MRCFTCETGWPRYGMSFYTIKLKKMKKKFWVQKIVGFIVCGALIVALLGFVVMNLWNSVLAEVVHVSPVSFWQALGLLVLSKILFGGFRKGGWGRHKGRHWKRHMADREAWQGMTPEEREKIKQEWRNRCRMWGRKEGDTHAGAE